MYKRSWFDIAAGGCFVVALSMLLISPVFSRNAPRDSTKSIATDVGYPVGGTAYPVVKTVPPVDNTATPDAYPPPEVTGTPDAYPPPNTTPMPEGTPSASATPETTPEAGSTPNPDKGQPKPAPVVVPSARGGQHVVDEASGAKNVVSSSGQPMFVIGSGVVAQTSDPLTDERGMLEGVAAVYLDTWLTGQHHFNYQFSMSTVSPHANQLWIADAQPQAEDIQILCLNEKGEWSASNAEVRSLNVQPIVDATSGEVVDYDVQVDASITQHGLCGLFVRNDSADDANAQARAQD